MQWFKGNFYYMNILEKEIEEIIYESLINNSEELQKRGLVLYPNCIRQLDLGSYGRADLICYKISKRGKYRAIYIQILELKKDTIDASTMMQSFRYEKGLREMIENSFNFSNTDIIVSHIIIGKTIQLNGDFVFSLDSIPNLRAYTYKIDLINGINFKYQMGYQMSGHMVGYPSKKVKDDFLTIFKNTPHG